MDPRAKHIVDEMNEVIAEWEQAFAAGRTMDDRDESLRNMHAARVKVLAAIVRHSPPGSSYYPTDTNIFQNLILSNLLALRDDHQKGRLRNSSELVRAEMFGDFLDMAEHLLSEQYKDAAAVIAGSSLEAHLRKLADKHGVPTIDDRGPKKAATLNQDLKKAGVYSAADEKSVSSWLALRNEAAHGHYEKYVIGQVQVLVMAVRDFITRHPA